LARVPAILAEGIYGQSEEIYGGAEEIYGGSGRDLRYNSQIFNSLKEDVCYDLPL
jgi:hypothetical protein